MYKELLIILLAGGCSSVKQKHETEVTQIKAKYHKTIPVTITYFGDLKGKNKGKVVSEGTVSQREYYSVNFSIEEDNITIDDFIEQFYKEAGINSDYKIHGGAPPNRHEITKSYNLIINNKYYNNERHFGKKLKDFITDTSKPIVIEVTGGGMSD